MPRWYLIAATPLAPVSVLAQQTSMPGMRGNAAAANEPASTTLHRDAMRKMGQDMAIPYSGDADRDFVAGTVPHHQGAIDMARVELQYGKDPELRKLARTIIAAQMKEIAFMQAWQVKHAR
jgi:uncharacterized protein (DUF305 family)